MDSKLKNSASLIVFANKTIAKATIFYIFALTVVKYTQQMHYNIMELDKVEDLMLLFPIINGKVSMAINRMMYRNFRKQGLQITPEQWTVLAFLWQEDGVTQQMLCNSTFRDKPSMTRLIDNLVKQNLVYRAASKIDRRSNYIHLTDLGRSIEDSATAAVYETMISALNGIDEEGVKRLRNVLALVFGNVSEALDR